MNAVTRDAYEEEPAGDGPAQYLSFLLAESEYAVDILNVREIRGLGPLTPLPNAPAHLCGVMNLRGAVVPVVDLRVVLGLPSAERTKLTVIVLLSVRQRTVGFIVDSVRDVLALEAGDIEDTPVFGTQVDSSLVGGIARVEGRFVVLLDIDAVVASDFPTVTS